MQLSSMLHVETLSGVGIPSIEEITLKVVRHFNIYQQDELQVFEF